MNDLAEKYDAVVLDLDGVVTDTARLHFRAGKPLLGEGGAEIEDAAEQIRRWRARGLGIAVVSSSHDRVDVLDASGSEDRVGARVDGEVAAEVGPVGKPAPDLFCEAARRLGVAPHRAVAIGAAVAGVEAARRGDFGLVVGIGAPDREQRLRDAGADLVVTTIAEIERHRVPHGFEDGMLDRLRGRRLAIFLDYDGTLSEIVDDPDAAVMTDGMRDALEALARRWPVAVVSGRERTDVAARVGIDGIYYAGSHGFDIAGPDPAVDGAGRLHWEHEAGLAALPELSVADRGLQSALAGIEGVLVERKRFSVAVHFRRVRAERVPDVERAVDAELACRSGLRKDEGKKIFELKPDVDWHKGHAIAWIFDALALDDEVLSVYVGDDRTDEDAFRSLRGRGIGVYVGGADEATAADYRVAGPREVEVLLRRLTRLPDGKVR